MGSHFGESPYFAVIQIGLKDGHVKSKKILENPHRVVERGKGIRVAEWLIDEKIDKLILKEDIKHKGPEYVLSNAGIMVRLIVADTLEEAISSVSGRNASLPATGYRGL
jgi:predicted Fe-Mo cluster-binding NifX family protein